MSTVIREKGGAITITAHFKRIAAFVAGGASVSPIAYMAFGDGGHNVDNTPKIPAKEATGLHHEILRKPLSSIVQEDSFSTTGKAVIAAGELNGSIISEIALIDAAGNLVSINNFTPKQKTSNQSYEVGIRLRI